MTEDIVSSMQITTSKQDTYLKVQVSPETYSEPCLTPKMELFVKTVNGF